MQIALDHMIAMYKTEIATRMAAIADFEANNTSFYVVCEVEALARVVGSNKGAAMLAGEEPLEDFIGIRMQKGHSLEGISRMTIEQARVIRDILLAKGAKVKISHCINWQNEQIEAARKMLKVFENIKP